MPQIQPPCPQCKSEITYADRELWVCTQCAHEWSLASSQEFIEDAPTTTQVRDVNGNVLQDGDAVIVIKDLKVKGASSAVKGGTKVKSIRLVDGHDGHNIDCKIDGFGAMRLKSIFVKKA